MPALQGYVSVKGEIRTAPLDLASRMERIYSALSKAGWIVIVRSLGTDFVGPLGLPVPKSQPFELWLKRKDRTATKEEAKRALEVALKAAMLDYSPLSAYADEVSTQVVVPTLKTLEKGVTSTVTGTAKLIPWVGAGLVAVAVIYGLTFVPRPRRN